MQFVVIQSSVEGRRIGSDYYFHDSCVVLCCSYQNSNCYHHIAACIMGSILCIGCSYVAIYRLLVCLCSCPGCLPDILARLHWAGESLVLPRLPHVMIYDWEGKPVLAGQFIKNKPFV